MVRKSQKKGAAGPSTTASTKSSLIFRCIHRLQAASAQDSLELCLVVGVLDNSEDPERPAGRALKGNEDEEEEDSLQRRRSLW